MFEVLCNANILLLSLIVEFEGLVVCFWSGNFLLFIVFLIVLAPGLYFVCLFPEKHENLVVLIGKSSFKHCTKNEVYY